MFSSLDASAVGCFAALAFAWAILLSKNAASSEASRTKGAPKCAAKAKAKEQEEMKVFEKLEARAKARATKKPTADASKDLKILMGAMKFAK